MTTALADALPRLAAHRDRLARQSLRSLIAADPDRFASFSARLDDLTIDFAKVRIDRAALADLVALATAGGVAEATAAMFGGEPINRTEGRAVLHAALRAGPGDSFRTAGADVTAELRAELERVLEFAEGVRSGRLHGERGTYSDVVNIGIGGSDLGPAMVTRALRPYHDGPRLHFVSNVDGAHIHDTLAGLDPARTLFIVASKTFTTIETMTNAATARRWIIDRQGEAAVSRHFAAVSTAVAKAGAFGIPADRVFGFWDWVGGRYSVWSAIGLPVAIAVGREAFSQFLAGARAMDRHFQSAPAAANLPVLLALIGVWHRNVWGFPALAVLPYDQRLDRLPAYLQQLDMESNGKSVTLDGQAVAVATGPLVWGEPGTNGQHAFYQFLHQGTDIVPCEFLVAAEGHELPSHHELLLANCLAQSEALMRGKTRAEAEEELLAQGLSKAEVARLAPHKVFPGDRPSVTILYRKLDPYALGRLIALYEHKVFVQGVLYRVNSFDQWGVELGKQLASELLPVVRGEAEARGRDPATAGLVAAIRALRAERAG